MRIQALLRTACLLSLTLHLSASAQTPDDPLHQQKITSQVADANHTYFHAVDTIFPNPGQGFFGEPWRPSRFPASVVYLRFNWLQVEPADGKFDWSLIDNAIAKAHQQGATVAMRVETANAHTDTMYSSPKWLFDEGCKGYKYKTSGKDAAMGGKPIKRIEPKYSDPIYLAKHAAFMEAFGKRYNGDPNVEFLDIGSYGIWGEWHTEHPASIEVRKQIVDMYLKAFDNTPLVYMSDDAEVMPYALAHGAGLRRDGVGDPWHEARWAGTPAYANVPAMGDAWKQAPIVFEWFQYYSYMVARGWSFDSAVNWMLKNHVTMINDDLGPVPPEAMPQLEKLERLAGYRFILHEVAQPKSIEPGAALPLIMEWENAGVGKLYRAYTLSLQLRNANGEVVAKTTALADPRDWLPGEYTVEASIPLPADLKPGDYTLTLGLFDTANQRPPLHLAIDAPNKEGWYTITQIAVK